MIVMLKENDRYVQEKKLNINAHWDKGGINFSIR